MDGRFALDRASVRTKDVDGRLHIAITPISKANVCGYLGKEIPDYETLGLDADRMYQLLRDPEELAKAASTFQNIPLLNKHIPVSAADPQKDSIVGSTGTDAEFTAPYLRNSLVVWDADAIDGIESGDQRELSAAYRYVPVMEPGDYQGTKYDGRMTSIVGNHVALVEKGRAGPDVVVGDAAPSPIPSPEKEPRHMAARKILSPSAAKARTALTAELTPLIAQDADLGALVELLDTLEKKEGTEGNGAAEPAPDGVPGDDDVAIDADPAETIRALLAGKVPDEDIAKIVALIAPPAAKDAEPETDTDDKLMKKDDEGDKKESVNKPAMDAAIAVAVKSAEANTVARLNAIREAERFVRPWIGEIAIAQDSAASVYKLALDSVGADVKGVDPSAFKAILRAYPLPGASPKPRIAADAASSDGFRSRFPNIAAQRTV